MKRDLKAHVLIELWDIFGDIASRLFVLCHQPRKAVAQLQQRENYPTRAGHNSSQDMSSKLTILTIHWFRHTGYT